MARRWTDDAGAQDVTPKAVWMNRRRLLGGGGAMMGGALAAGIAGRPGAAAGQSEGQANDLAPNSYEEITSYNNFYEFGTGKSDPAENAGAMETTPWSVTVDGLVDDPGTYGPDALFEGLELHDRIYRLRCVEAWSMVIPWSGYQLSDLLERAGVQEGARYVALETAVIPEAMPGVRARVLDFPYLEGLRLDEAMHPLTLIATGIYDEPLPNQNGAPLRLVVPWKYGFKSIKSLVRISLVAEEPPATWNRAAPEEYGFYANVNPNVDHRRWSQATEKRVGGGLFARRRPTLMFNGYEEVADLYEGMDLAAQF